MIHDAHHTQPDAGWSRFLPGEAATEALGRQLAGALEAGLTVYLSGDLGAGKTALVRAILRGMGYTGRVKSPTYTLVEHYVISSLYLYHFDLYRFGDPREWLDAGFHEHFGPDSICLVEWPEKAAGWLPAPDLRIQIVIQDHGRQVNITAETEKGAQCLQRMKTKP